MDILTSAIWPLGLEFPPTSNIFGGEGVQGLTPEMAFPGRYLDQRSPQVRFAEAFIPGEP